MVEKPHKGISDNPSAFPIPLINEPGAYAAEPGMSLRDYFAGQALAGSLARYGVGPIQRDEDIPSHFQTCARNAYGLADAMLAARSEGRTDG